MTTEFFCPKCNSPNPKDTVFCGKCGTRIVVDSPDAPVTDPLIGTFVGDRFLVHEKLGEGGMGVVYRAEQTAIKREVALKVLHSNLNQDESLFARFQNEAAASSRLNHPNTITIYDFGKTASNSLYIAMEFVKGKSLDDEIQSTGAMPVNRACSIGRQICGSLQDAHDNGIVHRDLKPENVMLCSRAGEKDVVKVLDFGIAKIMEDESQDQRKALTKTGMVFGTPQYMSPEQIRGEKVDNRTDIYSLGVMMYQMLTGALPFNAETPMGLLTKHLMDIPAPLEPQGIPSSVAVVVMSALEKDPSARPQSMREFGQRLSEAAGLLHPTTSAVAATSSPSAKTIPQQAVSVAASSSAVKKQQQKSQVKSPESKPIPIVPIIAAVVLLAGGGATAWYFTAGPGAKSDTQTATVATVSVPPQLPAGLPQVSPPVPTGGIENTSSETPTNSPDPLPSTLVGTPSSSTEPRDSKAVKKPKTGDASKTPSVDGIPDDIKNKVPEEYADKIPDKVPDKIPDKIPDEIANPKKDTDTPVADPPPGEKQKDVKCSFSSSNNAVSKAVADALKRQESVLKNCAKTQGDINGRLQFSVGEKAIRVSDLKTISGNTEECIKPKMATAVIKPQDAGGKGIATFVINATDKIVSKCEIKVTIIPAGGEGIRNLIGGGGQ